MTTHAQRPTASHHENIPLVISPTTTTTTKYQSDQLFASNSNGHASLPRHDPSHVIINGKNDDVIHGNHDDVINGKNNDAINSNNEDGGGTGTPDHSGGDGHQKDDDQNTTASSGPSSKSFFQSLSGRRRHTLFLATMAQFLATAAFSLLAPFYVIDTARRGINVTFVGVVYGSYELVMVLTAPIYGKYLVTLGPRFVYLAGIFVGGSCCILFGTLQYCHTGMPYMVMSVLIRVVEAVGVSAFATASFAIVSSQFKGSTGIISGFLQGGSGLGVMLGPMIGGTLYQFGGFGLPFYVAGVAILLNGVAVFVFLPPVEEVPAKSNGSVSALLRSPLVAVSVCSQLANMIGMTAMETTLTRHMQPLGFSVGMVGVLFGVTALISSLASPIWGYVSDRHFQSPLIVLGHLIFVLGLFLLGPTPFLPLGLSVVTILTGLVCMDLTFGCILIASTKCVVMGAVDELGFHNNIETYALVSGLFNTVNHFSGFVGPIAVGHVIDRWGFPVSYTAVAMLSVTTMIVSLVFFTRRHFRNKGR